MSQGFDNERAQPMQNEQGTPENQDVQPIRWHMKKRKGHPHPLRVEECPCRFIFWKKR